MQNAVSFNDYLLQLYIWVSGGWVLFDRYSGWFF